MARIRVALRRRNRGASEKPQLSVGSITIDFDRHQVTVDAQEVRLTPIEYKMLASLMRNAGKVMTHEQLLKEVWGPTHGEEAHYLRIYIHQLRQKVEKDPARPKFLLTEVGVGYRFKDE